MLVNVCKVLMQLILSKTKMNVFLYLCTVDKILVTELETLDYDI